MTRRADLSDWLPARRGELAAAAGVRPTAVRPLLMAYADELRTLLDVSADPLATWAPLGIRVVKSASLPTSGLAGYPRGVPTVVLSATDDARRRRFTAAHEVAHLLVGEGGARENQRARHAPAEERLCDAFAARLLAPPASVASALAAKGLEGPDDVFALAHALGTTLTATVLALSQAGHDAMKQRAIFLARPHAHGAAGPHAWRVVAYAGAPLLLPRGQRLRSVGLSALDRRLAAPSADDTGSEQEALFQGSLARRATAVEGEDHLRAPARRSTSPRSGWASGPVCWRAHRSGPADSGHAVVVLNTHSLDYSWGSAEGS